MTFNACWTFTETKQWMLAQWGGGWRVSAVATATFQTSHVLDSHAQLSHHEMKSISISSCMQISGLRLGNCVRSWILASMHWKRWWQRWNIPKFASGGFHECSHRNIKNTTCKFVRTYVTNMRLKVKVSWIASSPVTRHGVTTTSRSQNGSPWSGDMWIPHQRKSSRRCPQRVKRCALSFGIGKGWSFWISLNPDKPLTLNLKAQIYGVRPEMKTTFLLQHENARSHTSLKTVEHNVNPGLSNHTHRIFRIWCFLTSICSGRWKMDCMGNIFLATTPWNSGPPLLVQIFTSAACRLIHRWWKCIANGVD